MVNRELGDTCFANPLDRKREADVQKWRGSKATEQTDVQVARLPFPFKGNLQKWKPINLGKSADPCCSSFLLEWASL